MVSCRIRDVILSKQNRQFILIATREVRIGKRVFQRPLIIPITSQQARNLGVFPTCSTRIERVVRTKNRIAINAVSTVRILGRTLNQIESFVIFTRS